MENKRGYLALMYGLDMRKLLEMSDDEIEKLYLQKESEE